MDGIITTGKAARINTPTRDTAYLNCIDINVHQMYVGVSCSVKYSVRVQVQTTEIAALEPTADSTLYPSNATHL